MAHEIGKVERGGKVWTIRKVHVTETDEEDFRFWYLGMTPEERILAVADCTESCLKARGLDGLPGLRRVYRRIKCK
ncbi:hypothetical protein GC170_10620 [bacterium]|nr:hypothetical protein [bacterium]